MGLTPCDERGRYSKADYGWRQAPFLLDEGLMKVLLSYFRKQPSFYGVHKFLLDEVCRNK